MMLSRTSRAASSAGPSLRWLSRSCSRMSTRKSSPSSVLSSLSERTGSGMATTRQTHTLSSRSNANGPRAFSSLSDRFWDIVESRSLTPTSPIVDDVERIFGLANEGRGDDDSSSAMTLPDFSRIRGHHLVEASEKLQDDYDIAWERFEKDLARFVDGKADAIPASTKDVLVKLDSVSSPLRYLENLVRIYGSLLADQETAKALGRINIDWKHERSHILGRALLKLKGIMSEGGSGGEYKVAVNGLLRELEERGLFLNEDDDITEEVQSIQEQLDEAEKTFTALVAGNSGNEKKKKPASPKECLSLMYEILALKQQRSQLLGYASYAHWSLEPTMAQTVETASSLNSQIAKRLVPQLSKEIMAQHESAMAERDDLRMYFQMERVLEGMFGLSKDLFGIDVVEADEGNAKGWHDDVRLFHVHDENTGDRIGSFYLDPYRRLLKQPGNSVLPLISRQSNQNQQLKQLVCLTCNIRPPVWDTDPAYLTFDDVAGLFRTYGIALQHLLPEVELGSFSGADKIQKDAVDFVGQFMEHWLYEESILSEFAIHAQTGEPIMPDQIHNLKQLAITQKRIDLCRHLFRSQLELSINSEFQPPFEDQSLVALQKDYAQQYIPHESLARGDISPLIDIFQTNARSGVDTLCYRYVWSETMSADAFAAFQDGGAIGDREKMRQMGIEFGRTIFEAGAAVNVGEAYEQFWGKECTPEALFRHLGWI